uniref:Uncharacterized protein n=1 Tax=Nelumbo nucifera TaxID=4432 RepID=A0A822ZA88_NELNU|nr:TPA_asm: hypothetical protein HUJ06_014269 [Nelumbo nucifera]
MIPQEQGLWPLQQQQVLKLYWVQREGQVQTMNYPGIQVAVEAARMLIQAL